MSRHLMTLLAVAALGGLLARPASATPEWSRRYQAKSCNTCHTVAPKLNERGLDFLARGYQPDPEAGEEAVDTVPLAVWVTMNHDNRISRPVSKTFLGKVELISGGALSEDVSYLVEWRPVSLETRANGSLQDRSGRFEDLWLSWRMSDRWSFLVGQYRPLGQVDPGRKISLSTPAIYDQSVEEKEKARNSRLQSLSAFSTNGRSPGFTLGYQSIRGENASDGLFHNVTLAFPGELSIPLNDLARKEASFELDGTPKGVLLETYYREKLDSIGAHLFVDDDRWMLTGVGAATWDDFSVTAGLGVDHVDGRADRTRMGLELEYLPTVDSDWRPGFGFRVEDVTADGRPPAYVPYLALSGPNTEDWTSLLQIEYFGRARDERFRIDFSVIF